MNIVFFDFEVNSVKDMEPIEGAIQVRGKDELAMVELFSCNSPISPMAQSIHHISEKDIKDKPIFTHSEFFKVLEEYVESRAIFCAHGFDFDLKVLTKYVLKEGSEPLLGVCTHLVARKYFEDEENKPENYKLQYLRYFLKLDDKMPEGILPHRAASDVIVLEYLFKFLNAKYSLEEMVDITTEGLKPENYVIYFGKYSGKTLGWIYLNDLEYFKWALKSFTDEELLVKMLATVDVSNG